MIYYRSLLEGIGHREQSGCARVLLLEALQKEYGLCELPQIAVAEHGKPFFPELPGLYFNYSHSKSGLVCGISDGNIGVDIETIRPFREKTARRFSTNREWNWLKSQGNQESHENRESQGNLKSRRNQEGQENQKSQHNPESRTNRDCQENRDNSWIRLWTLKEAYLKYRGTGLSAVLSEIDFTEAVTAPEGIAVRFQEPGKADCWIGSVYHERSWVSVCGDRRWDGRIVEI